MISKDPAQAIFGHLHAIEAATTSGWGSGLQARVRKIQWELDAIKELLKPEPEPSDLASSVFRLTDLLNAAEAENHKLKQAVTADKSYIVTLKKQLASFRKGWCPYDCATRDERAELRAHITRKNLYIETLEKKLASREACLRRNQRTLERARECLQQ